MKSTSIREFLAVLFRHRALVVFSFFGIFLGALAATLLQPRQFQSEMKILVKRERVDPIISPQQASPVTYISDVTEEIINSEVTLIKSYDLLQKVVAACGMTQDLSGQENLTAEQKKVQAGQNLAAQLDVEPIRRTNLIRVNYVSSSPEKTVKVLESLAVLYLDKHLEVHRPAGTFDFFQKQSAQYQSELTKLEEELLEFNRSKALGSAQSEQDNLMRKMVDFDYSYRETLAAISGADAKIRSLETLLASTPDRITSQIKISDNPFLHDHLKSELMTLNLRRIELLTRFTPEYRLVQEVDAKIRQIQYAIQEAGNINLRDETTDRNPDYDWIRTELSRARAERATLQSKAQRSSQELQNYHEALSRLDQEGIQQQRLTRQIRNAEENFQLYSRKAEEARITDAMDRQRIVNVAIAEPASPARASSPLRLYILIMSLFLASLISISGAYLADYFDPTFRTPDEVEAILRVPMLAVIQKNPD